MEYINKELIVRFYIKETRQNFMFRSGSRTNRLRNIIRRILQKPLLDSIEYGFYYTDELTPIFCTDAEIIELFGDENLIVDGVVMLKPYIRLELLNNRCEFKYFDTMELLQEFVEKNNLNLDKWITL
jgi:hypothetical protein